MAYAYIQSVKQIVCLCCPMLLWRAAHGNGVCKAACWHINVDIVCTDVRCWAFNPPGALVSANLSAVMSSFCTSVVSLPGTSDKCDTLTWSNPAWRTSRCPAAVAQRVAKDVTGHEMTFSHELG